MKKLFIGVMLFLSLAFAINSFATAGLSDTFYVSTPSGAQYPKTEFISATTAGDNTVLAAVAGKKIMVWHFEVSASATATVYWKSGSTAITETVYLDAYGGWSREQIFVNGERTAPLRTNVGEALVLNSNTTNAIGVWVKYTLE